MLLLTFCGATKLDAQAYCTMACHNLLNVSLPATCSATITYDMILTSPNNPALCSPNGASAFVVIVMDVNGTPIPGSPVVNASYIGQTLPVKVKHWATGNSCWGNIHIEDKLPPTLTCPPDVTVACTASTAPSSTGQATATDCSAFTLTYSDQTVNNGCTGSFSAIITRTWIAVDIGGYTKTCIQLIKISQPTSASVTFPLNRDGIQAPVIDCVNPNTAPSNTGFPTIGGQPIPANGTGFCNMAVTYTDQIIPLCQNSIKILRTWTVVNWCNGAIANHVQIISVKDLTPPVLTCPSNLTAGTTSSVQCKANVILPQVAISDNCSTTFTTTMNTPAGLIASNGGQVNNLNVGTYTITYNVTDNCGNQASCSMQLTVTDDDAPTVVCDQNTVVTLTNDGTALVNAITFDDGSYDNCGPVTFQVRRMVAGCGVNNTYGPQVKLCCADIGTVVQVQLKVTDVSGNMNTCMVNVTAEDKTAPAILCPANKTITCLQDPNNLVLTGQPTATDGCGISSITHTDVVNLNLCDVGTITRTWTATDNFNQSNSCTQLITIVDNTPVTVTFPPNYAAVGCVNATNLQPNQLPAPYNAPVINSDCELMATNFTDQVFTVAAPACFKIVRTWKVINWCTYVPGSTVGLWEGVQIIMVTDNTPPTFTCPSGFNVGVGANCKGSVTLPQVTNIQDCSQSTFVTVTSSFGSGYGPFPNVNPGTYSATYTVSDGCNNNASCTIQITVADDKKPTPYCVNGLVIELMVSNPPMVQTWASDFNAGSFDNCPGTLKFSFSSNVSNTGLTLDCDDVGQVPVQIWVTDVAGNQDYCVTYIIVQANMNQCPGDDPLMAGVSGDIQNEEGEDLEGVTVSVNNALPTVLSDEDGAYNFAALQTGEDYTVSPDLNTGLLNGVSTYDLVLLKKHILGMALLDSPYKMIAGDVNNSGSISTLDMVDLQKVVLQMTTAFPNNESWRFVDAAYTFPNPANPWQEMFPEVYNINDLGGNMLNVNFTAIKIGDLNGNALTNFAAQAEERSGGTLTLRVKNEALQQNQEQRVDFTVENFRQIVGYQFTLNFDPSHLEFIRLENGALESLTETNFGFSLLEEGAITTSWNDLSGITLPDDAVLFSLVFKAKSAASLGNLLRISSDYTTAEAYFESGELLDVELKFYATPLIPHPSSLVPKPNPFSDLTVLGFTLAEPQDAILTIFDPAGKAVRRYTGSFPAGYNELNVRGEDLPGNGTYLWQLKTAGEVKTGKMVLMD